MSTILPGNQDSAALALDGGSYGLLARRNTMMQNEPYVLTTATHPNTLALLYHKGWCKSPDGITKKEFSQVNSFGTFKGLGYSLNGESMDWMEYLTSVTTIPYGEFNASWWNIGSFKLPPNLVSIQDDALRSLKTVVPFTLRIPASVRTIRPRSLFYQGTVGQHTIIFEGVTPPTSFSPDCLGPEAARSSLEIYVPDVALNDYMNAFDGLSYNSIVLTDKIKPMSEYQQ